MTDLKEDASFDAGADRAREPEGLWEDAEPGVKRRIFAPGERLKIGRAHV